MNPYIVSADIRKEKICFVTSDSVWMMDYGKFEAYRLFGTLGEITDARLSPDMKTVYFRVAYSEAAYHADIFSIHMDSGQVERLTYLSGYSVSRRPFTQMAGFSPEGDPIISTNALLPFANVSHLYRVRDRGKSIEDMKIGIGSHIFYDENGGMVIGRNTLDMIHWKGYKGGTKGVIWRGNLKDGFKKIIDMEGNVTSPVISGKRIYFILDEGNSGNIYSTDLNGEGLRKETDFKDKYARSLSGDDSHLIFIVDGEIHIFDLDSRKILKPEIKWLSPSFYSRERKVTGSKYMEEICLSGNGKTLGFVVRGRAFVSGERMEPLISIPEEYLRIRNLRFVDENTIIFSSDMDGEEKIYSYDFMGNHLKTISSEIHGIETMEISPDRKYIGAIDGNFNLVIVNVESGRAETLEYGEKGPVFEPVWHPDSRRIAYTVTSIPGGFGSMGKRRVRIYDLEKSMKYDMSTGDMNEYSPSFSPDGSYLYYITDRDLRPVHDRILFSYDFLGTSVVNCVPLTGDIYGPESTIPESLRNGKNERDLSGAIRGTFSLEIGRDNYEKIMASKNGIFLLRETMDECQDGMCRLDLLYYDFKERKIMEFSRGVKSAFMSEDKSRIVIRNSKSKILIMDIKERIGRKPDEKDVISLNPSSISFIGDERREWRQMFLESARLARDNFWRADRGKEIYGRVIEKYKNLLDRVSSRTELSWIIREMQGEFGTSHSYETGGDFWPSFPHMAGKLGIDMVFKDGRYEISKIYYGDISDSRESSPIGRMFPENFKIIKKINDVDVSGRNPYELLLDTAGKTIPITLASETGEERREYVKILNDDRNMRYRDWVISKRSYVHEKTGGKVGYIHIPDMSMAGMIEFSRSLYEETSRDGLIVDIRYNGGGHTSQIVMEKIMKERMGYSVPRRGSRSPYPSPSVNGPVVAITNEYAGSDGDIFGHYFKQMKLGPLIGKRSWGGVIGIAPRRTLLDGTIVTQPEFGLWFRDIGFGLENRGTIPDIEIEYPPEDYFKNFDPQLEKALEKCREMMEKTERKVDFREF